jgi:hypothetical protein
MGTTDLTTAVTAALEAPAPLDFVAIRADRKRYPRLYQIPRPVAVAQLTPLIIQAFMDRGQKADTDAVKYTACRLYDEIIADRSRRFLRQITIPEIGYAVRRAVFGQSGHEFYGINAASLFQAVCDYTATEGDAATAALYASRKGENIHDVTPSKAVGAVLDAYSGAMLKNNKNR